jgi:ABC-2 type transport system permease protein
METVQTPLRERIGQYASYVGLALLMLAMIGWLWQGGITTAIILLFGFAAVAIAVWFTFTPQEAIGLVTGRRARFGTVSVLMTLVLIGVVVAVYILLQRATITLDMTNRQDFTLDDETEGILDALNQTVRITGFYSPSAIQQREIDDQIFRLYEAYTNGLVERVYIDPEEQPSVAEAFGMQFDGDVFVSYLTPEGLVDFNTVSPVYRETNTERDMTAAIARLTLAGRFKVYFEIGYTNVQPNETQQGISGVLAGLRDNGIEVGTLNLGELGATGQWIPEDASTLVITRSNNDLDGASIGVLDEYLKRGGSVFILTDALFTDNPLLAQDGLFNQYLWENYGIRALDAVVVDAIANDTTSELNVSSYAVFPNEMGERLNQGQDMNTYPLFRVARALEVNTQPPVPNGQVIATSPQSYGERDFARLAQAGEYQWDAGQDVAGPFALVAWANNETTGAKVVVAGDTDFITNGLVLAPQGNSILFTDVIGWLTGFTESVNFEFQAFTSGLPLIFVAPTTLDLIAFITVVLMPGFFLLTGFLVWVRRSRA